MTIQTKQLLPVLIPRTKTLVEASPDGYFIQHTGESFLQILYKDSLNPNSSPILQPDLIHRLWNGLRMLYEEGEDSIPFWNRDERKEFMRYFYSQEAKSIGGEVGDLESTLQQLHREMRYTSLFMNALVVIRDDSRLVKKLGKKPLPIAIQPLSVYTNAPITPKYQNYGITLKEFREAGGRTVAHGTSNAPSIFSDYMGKHNDIEAVRWWLAPCPPVDVPSNTYEPVPLDARVGGGVLRGRKIATKNKHH